MSRTETRRQRYANKAKVATRLPVEVACTNFSCDENVAYLARALACFGGINMHVIGKVPQYSTITKHSGGHSNLIKIIQHSNPVDFIQWARENDRILVCAELQDGAKSLTNFKFDFSRPSLVVLGNEMDGIPVEISKNADHTVYIPMPGNGFCLNTSQAGNVILYEYSRQYLG